MKTETKATHTPGPWKVIHELNVEANGRGICACGHSNSSNPNTIYENMANARLIAAAPELLEALKALAECHEAGYHPSIDKWMKVKDAIAKAEGK